jgi:hypothetical protein
MKSAFLAAMFLPALAFSVSCSLEEATPGAAGGAGGSGGSGTSSGGTGATAGTSSSSAGGGGTTGGSGPTTGGSGGTTGGSGGTTGGSGGGSGGTTGGSGGTTGGSGGTGGGSLIDLASELDNQTYKLPCGPDRYPGSTVRVCCNNPGGSETMGVCNDNCPSDPDLALTGFRNKDTTINFGGTAGTTYAVTLRVRGVVEPKVYQNCPKLGEGFCGGPNAAPAEPGAYNVYMIEVANTAGTSRYFLNALDEPEAHTSYGIDDEVTIDIEGGAAIRLVAADENCTAIANCSESNKDEQQCPPVTVDLSDHPEIMQPYDGQFVVVDVLNVAAK